MADLRRLQDIADRLGIQLDAEAVERLTIYRDLLLEANTRINLTSITDPDEVEVRLLADTLALLTTFPGDARRLLDIGSGGGIPGIPSAIMRPDLQVVLLDATGKKVRFLQEAVEALGLENVTAIHGRAEELARDGRHRERYDVVTARAVARLVTLVELALPFARIGGQTILPKGSAAAEELEDARYAIGIMGGKARPLVVAPLEGTIVVIIDKLRPTPPTYPRRTGLPSKSPLTGHQSTS